MARIRISWMISALFLLLPATAHSQDFGGMLRSVVGRAFGEGVAGAFQSITSVTIGRVMQGAIRPPDMEGKVILYRTATCGYCKKAAAYMTGRKIAFVERDINVGAMNLEEYKLYGGDGGVPLIVFGSETMRGFKESTFDDHYARMGLETSTGQAAPLPSEMRPGDLLHAKLASVPVYVEPSKNAARAGVFGSGESAVYMGEERNGFYRVTVVQGEGWVDKLLVSRPGT